MVPDAVTRLPLTGADCFLRAFDGEVRRWSGSSHLSQLILRLGPGFSSQALRHALDKVAQHNPILSARIERRFGLAAPAYRWTSERGPSPIFEVHRGGVRSDEVPSLFFERLNGVQRPARGELLRLDAVRYDDESVDLAMTWLHMLLDGSGSEALVELLEGCSRGSRAPDDSGDSSVENPSGLRGLRGRGEQARAWREALRTKASRPPRSLAGPLKRSRQQLRYDLQTFDVDATRGITERAQSSAGFLTPMLFYLAAAIRAHHRVFVDRGRVPESYLVPLPVNLRPRGTQVAVFRTHVSMLWFQVFPEDVESLDGLIDVLKRQRREMIRQHEVENGLAAMDFARWMPKRLYSRMARRDFAGELCSFFFAYTDDFLPTLKSFMGAPIVNGFHAPSVPPSPGSSAIFSIRAGRLNATHVHQQDVLSPSELASFWGQLREDLAG